MLQKRVTSHIRQLGRCQLLRPRQPLASTPSGRAILYRSASSSTHSQRRPETNWNQFIGEVSKVSEPEEEKEKKTDGKQYAFTLAVKDNIATSAESGLPTTCGSAILEGYLSPFEATIVGQLRARGAQVVGKTNLDEFGMGSHSLFSHAGPVAAPEKGALSVGGSSGGSAVAVRLGDVDVALGTDTGGSVRLPAAYGGIVGFKPSYGMLSRYGVVPYANSLDTVGLLARDVAPIRRLLVGEETESKEEKETEVVTSGLWKEADTDHDPTTLSQRSRRRIAGLREGYTRPFKTGENQEKPLHGISFGIPLEYNILELDESIRAAWTDMATLVQDLGATVALVSLPTTKHALSTYYVIAPAEASSNLARYDGIRYGRPGSKDAQKKEPGSQPESKLESESKSESNSEPETESDSSLYGRVRGAYLGSEVKQRIVLGSFVLSSAAHDNYFLQAQRVRRLVVRDFDAVFQLANPLRDPDADMEDGGNNNPNSNPDNTNSDDSETLQPINLSDLPEELPLADRQGPAQVDFLLCPTAPTPAPLVDDLQTASSSVQSYVNDVFTVPASLAGLPAINIPAPPTAASSPPTFCAGLQLIGQFFDDARLLHVAETLMEAAFARPQDRDALAKHRQTGVETK